MNFIVRLGTDLKSIKNKKYKCWIFLFELLNSCCDLTTDTKLTD